MMLSRHTRMYFVLFRSLMFRQKTIDHLEKLVEMVYEDGVKVGQGRTP